MLYKLECGTTLILEKRSYSKAISIVYAIKTGSFFENSEITGISHFIEHMVFKGSKQRSVDDIKKPIESVGGTINAFTSNNLTVYYVKVPSFKIEEALNILTDMVFNPAFKEEDIENERKVILEEIHMLEDDPVDNVFELFRRNFYRKPFSLPIIGLERTLKKLERNDLMQFHNKYYSTDNLVISIVGDINERKIKKYLEEVLCTVNKRGKSYNMKSPIFKKVKKYRVEKSKKDLKQNYVIIGYEAPSKLSKDYYPFLVTETFLGSGMSSFLFTKIREEKGLVYDISTIYNVYPKTGVFQIFFSASNKNTDSLINEVTNEIRTLLSKDMNKWIEYGKSRIEGKFYLDTESNFYTAMFNLDSFLFYGKVLKVDEIVKKIANIKPKKIKENLKRMIEEKQYLAVLKPKEM